MEMANFSTLSPPTYKGASLRSLKPSNYPFNCSFYSIHHHIRFSKSSTKFKRKSFKISCSISSSSLKDNCRNSDAICNDSITDVWADSQFVEVIGIGNRVDSVLDFCISSHSTSHSLRFWNVIRRDSLTGQLRQRVPEKDDYPNIAEAPLNQQLHSKAVVLVASAGYGDDHVTAIDTLRAIRSSGGLVIAVIVKPFSFEGQRRQDEVKILVDKLRDCVNFCIDIDIDTLLKLDLVTLDEALKTAYQAVLSAISAVSIIVSDTCKMHIHSLHGSMTQITICEVIKVLESYKEGRIGYGVGHNVKASIVQAVYDCPFLSVGLKDLDGVVICILSSSSAIADNDVGTLLRTFREATKCTKEVLLSTVKNPDMEPSLIETTVITVCGSERKSLQNSNILSRLADSIPFVFNFLRRQDMQSGTSEKNDLRENIFPPMMTNVMNEMLLDEDYGERNFEDGETDKVQYLDYDVNTFKNIEQIDQAQTFERQLFINRNLRPGHRISHEWHEEELNVSGADPLADNPRIFQLPVGVRLSTDLQDIYDDSNLSLSAEKINDEVQMQASSVPSVPQNPATPLMPNSNSRKLPDFKQSIKLKYVKLGYHYLITHGMYLFLSPLIVVIAAQLSTFSLEDVYVLWEHLRFNLISVIVCSTLLVFLATLYFLTRPSPVYLVNFSCYKPDDARKCTRQIFMDRSHSIGTFTKENLEFQRKILERSGLGEDTYLPESVLLDPPNVCMQEARKEAEMVMFGALDELFAKTNVKPKDIGILVVNCSLFNPTPSLSAMIVNHYKMRGNIVSYNLGGMGCSAGLISIDLAKHLLQVHPNSYAVVISTENITLNWYFGNERSMLVSNCLFRMGGAAILLSNKRSDRWRSKYQLVDTVRTHKGSDDKCFTCVTQEEDSQGKVGVALSKDLMAVAGDALKTNITTLGPLVLPVSEQLLFFATLIGKKVLKMKLKPYIPDFKLAFEHFCIHAGGRAVLDELEKNLQLSDWHMEPSRMTLNRFGNTSSSSLWYELAYSEAKGRVKRGDRIWQIAFGSGFKCNSAVWRALRGVNPEKEQNPWMDEIHLFPVDVPKVSSISN